MSTPPSRTTSACTSPTTTRWSRRGPLTCAAGERLPSQAMTDDLAFLDAVAQAELVRRGDLSPLELVDAAITRVEKLNPDLNAVIHPGFERARAEAAGSLPDGPFRGVPIVIKDLDGASAGDPLHNGNQALKAAGHVAAHDTWLVARLRDAGFVI